VTALMAKLLLLGNPNQAVGTYLHEHLLSPFNNFSFVALYAVFFVNWFHFIKFIIYGGFQRFY
jgi:phosphate starvation-inducible membrane PsiE